MLSLFAEICLSTITGIPHNVMKTFLLLCTKHKKNPLANYQGAAVVVEAVGNGKNFDIFYLRKNHST